MSRNPFKKSGREEAHGQPHSSWQTNFEAPTPPAPNAQPNGYFYRASNFVIQGSQFYDYQNFHYHHESLSREGRGLKELSNAVSHDAAFDSQARDPPPRCYPGTRVQILQSLKEWITNPQYQERIFWLYSGQFEGKSAIAQTFAEECHEMGLLGASFFFRADRDSQNRGGPVFPTIAHQLVHSIPEIRPYVDAVMQGDPTTPNKSLGDQLQKLIIEPLRLSGVSPSLPPVVILDGLNHCTDLRVQSLLIQLICRSLKDVPLRFLITLRHPNDPSVMAELQKCLRPVHTHITLDSTMHPAFHDIRFLLRQLLSEVYQERSAEFARARVPGPWPRKADLDTLAKNSSPYFSCVKYLCEQVRYSQMPPWEAIREYMSMAPRVLQGKTYNHYWEKMGSNAPPHILGDTSALGVASLFQGGAGPRYFNSQRYLR